MPLLLPLMLVSCNLLLRCLLRRLLRRQWLVGPAATATELAASLQKLSVHLPHYPQHNLLHHLTLLHRHKRLQSAARLYLRARLGLVGP